MTSDVAVVAGRDGQLLAFDLRDGSIRSRLRLTDAPITPAVAYDGEIWFGLADGTACAVEIGESGDQPLFTRTGVWTLPPSGSFRLRDRSVELQISSSSDQLVEWRVSSQPDEEVILTVLSSEGDIMATNMGDIALSDTVRIRLRANSVYRLRIERPRPEGQTILSVIESVVD